MNNTDYLKISNDIKKDFRIQYIKNMYLALRIVIAVVGLAEIIISLFVGEHLLRELIIAIIPIILNYTAFCIINYFDKKDKNIKNQTRRFSFFYTFICAVYCFFTIRFDFLGITLIAPTIALIPLDKKVLTHNFAAGIIILIIYTIYQLTFKFYGAYSSPAIIYISANAIICTIYFALYLTSKNIQNLISKITEATVNASFEREELAYKLERDELTGLYNSIKFEKDASNISYKSIAYLDVDNFKKINDTYGHEFGDKILIKVAECLSGSYSVLYRLHGDEFVILSHLDKFSLEVYLTSKIEIYKINAFQNYKIKTTLSVGITDFYKDKYEECLKRADDFLYKAKKNNKDIIKVDN